MSSLPSTITKIGIGFRQPHYQSLLANPPKLDFLEVHSENFFAAGGASLAVLSQARHHYDISLHGVSLGLGSALGLDTEHLEKLKQLVNRIEPFLVSDHACFARGSYKGFNAHANDLLPPRFTKESVAIFCRNINQVQETLGRNIAIENLSSYIEWQDFDYTEAQFLNEITQQTGCCLLLDVNNIYVNLSNTQRNLSPQTRIAHGEAFINELRLGSVAEIHLAGFTQTDDLIIDDHATAVHEPVWALFAAAQKRFPQTPSLIEWDLELPELAVLLAEAEKARGVCNRLTSAAMNEAAAQAALLTAIFDKTQALPSAAKPLHENSLGGYRGNLSANVERALGVMYPSLLSLLGAEDFDFLAQFYLRDFPPPTGDWAQYGWGFGDWLAQTNPGGIVENLPFLPDLARLNLAQFLCEAALDETADLASLQGLNQAPEAIRIALQSHVHLVRSDFPIADIALDVALTEAQNVCVYRDGWRSSFWCLSAAQAAFVAACLNNQDLAAAFSAAQTLDADFDLSTFLQLALEKNLILSILETSHE